jgi:hypothetical protein
VRGDKLGQEFNCITPDVTALVLQASGCQLSRGLSSLGELLLKITNSHKYLDRTAPAVRVDIEETLFQYIEKGVDLGFVVVAGFLLSAKISNEVSTNFDDCTAESVCLYS